MVGTLQPKAACGASEIPDRYEQMQHPNGNLRSPQHAHTNSMQIPKRARCRETLSDLVGRVFSLDIAFYRTPPRQQRRSKSARLIIEEIENICAYLGWSGGPTLLPMAIDLRRNTRKPVSMVGTPL